MITLNDVALLPLAMVTVSAFARVPEYFEVTVRQVDWMTMDAATSVPSVARTQRKLFAP